MKKLIVGLIVTMLGVNSFGAAQGYHNVIIKKVIVHFGYVVLQADSVEGNALGDFTDEYFIVPKKDNDLSSRKETLATLLSGQALGCDMKIWIHETTLDAGAGVVGNTLYSVQIITE